MDPADRVDGQWDHMVNIAAHDPFEAVAQPDDVDLFESGADGRRPDDAVNAGGGPAADQDGEIVMVLHKSMIAESRTLSAAIPAALLGVVLRDVCLRRKTARLLVPT